MNDDESRLMSGDAWRDFCQRLQATGESILANGFPDAPHDRAEGTRWLTRLIVHALQMEVEAGDTEHPFFIRYETPHNQWGGPNPDNVYLRANVDPRHTYRIWANVSGARQIIFSLNEGEMQLGEYGVFSEKTLDDLEVTSDGRLEIWLSPDEQAGNWMPTDPRGRLLTIRIYQSDWDRDTSPRFHIERVGAEGVPPEPVEPAAVARSLDRAAHWIERTAVFWNGYTQAGWQRATPNVAAAPRSAPGGADNILYGSCFFELEEEQALLLTCDVPDAQYIGFTLHTLGWLESGDFADRQTSLSGHQIHRDADGRMRVVVARRDPGVPNWVDATGRARGLLVYRWVFSNDNPVPEAQVVSIADLRTLLPEDHPEVDEAARRKALSRRREAAWNRFQ